jgi:hypothetical protein
MFLKLEKVKSLKIAGGEYMGCSINVLIFPCSVAKGLKISFESKKSHLCKNQIKWIKDPNRTPETVTHRGKHKGNTSRYGDRQRLSV